MSPKIIISRAVKRQILQPVIDERVFIAQNVDIDIKKFDFVRFFRPQIAYHPLCDDFGPMNISSIVNFIELLDSEMACYPSHKIIYCVESGKRPLTNAVFLLGAYMMLKLEATPQDLTSCFQWLDSTIAEPFRDATFLPSDFDLSLLDCWKGLQQGKNLGWIRLPTSTDPSQWGKINIDEYRHYEDPHNGDFAQIVPGKLIAFKGPVDLGGRDYHDDESGYRSLSPGYYARIFTLLGVRAVVRLNEPQYDPQDFEDHGISHHDMEFPDCTCPPQRVVSAFLKVVDSVGPAGCVAIHCKAGLGRTGTLIARYMMRSCGFSAREAMGWLRIMRPGSVIGQQQHYLCGLDRPMYLTFADPEGDTTRYGRGAAAAAAAAAGSPGVNALGGMVGTATARRQGPAAGGSGSLERAKSGVAAAAAAEVAAAQVAAAMRRRATERVMTR